MCLEGEQCQTAKEGKKESSKKQAGVFRENMTAGLPGVLLLLAGCEREKEGSFSLSVHQKLTKPESTNKKGTCFLYFLVSRVCT